MTDMIQIYRKTSRYKARKIYAQHFPTQRIPNEKMFQHLRNHGSFIKQNHNYRGENDCDRKSDASLNREQSEYKYA